MKQAVIPAGGKGARLRSRTGEEPKALVDVGGVPLLGRQLALLRDHGFEQVVLLVNYGAEAIRSYCRSFDAALQIEIVDDGQPRGTAGAVLHALPQLEREFLVLYGDLVLNVDLASFRDWHASDKTAAASLLVHPNDHPWDSDLVEIDDQNRILRFHPYPHPTGLYVPNLVNAALYAIRRDALAGFYDGSGPLDFAKQFFPEMLRRGAVLKGYVSPEYIRDAGTPERLDRVRRDWARGTISRSSLRAKQRAVFIDRDGTLNHARGHIARAEDLDVFGFVGPALRRLNENEWRTVVITNQPVVARGETTCDELRRIHAKLENEVARSQAYFDRIYHCPHHPDSGFAGEVAELKIECDCRKPAPGLIYQAAKDLNLDLNRSWFIGDSMSDIEAAAAAGVRSIFVTGSRTDEKASAADFSANNFSEAVDLILDLYPQLAEGEPRPVTF